VQGIVNNSWNNIRIPFIWQVKFIILPYLVYPIPEKCKMSPKGQQMGDWGFPQESYFLWDPKINE
jgi:hypothetical protein